MVPSSSSSVYCAVLTSLLALGAQSEDPGSPRIVVVGAGAAGIAAAAKLLEYGFENVLILEAENRIGGRVYTAKFGEYLVDLGAQWVHGDKRNVVYELAAPLNLLEHSSMEAYMYEVFTGPGMLLDDSVARNVLDFYLQTRNIPNSVAERLTGSEGDYFVPRFLEYFAAHPELNDTLRDELLWHYNIVQVSGSSANSWFDVAAYSNYTPIEGDYLVNWKDKGYGTILDVLMKKIPDPEKELPVRNKTILNSEVVKIDHTDENGPIKVTTSDGREYLADHVIVTVSLGVLKAEYETLFDPPLPERKINSIRSLGFGAVAKLLLAFEEPWWMDVLEHNKSGFAFLWDKETREEYKNTPGAEWISYMEGCFFIQHKPRLLLCWISGEGAHLLDTLPDEQVFNQTVSVIEELFSPVYNFTPPTAMIRNQWSTNKHFRGTYSYKSVEAAKLNASAAVLSEPIMRLDKPIILFGGEATNQGRYATVHGAIESGWREAHRLIRFYSKSDD